jgi:hypothetical protein
MVLASEIIGCPNTRMLGKGFLLDVFCRKLRYPKQQSAGLKKFPVEPNACKPKWRGHAK